MPNSDLDEISFTTLVVDHGILRPAGDRRSVLSNRTIVVAVLLHDDPEHKLRYCAAHPPAPDTKLQLVAGASASPHTGTKRMRVE